MDWRFEDMGGNVCEKGVQGKARWDACDLTPAPRPEDTVEEDKSVFVKSRKKESCLGKQLCC